MLKKLVGALLFSQAAQSTTIYPDKDIPRINPENINKNNYHDFLCDFSIFDPVNSVRSGHGGGGRNAIFHNEVDNNRKFKKNYDEYCSANANYHNSIEYAKRKGGESPVSGYANPCTGKPFNSIIPKTNNDCVDLEGIALARICEKVRRDKHSGSTLDWDKSVNYYLPFGNNNCPVVAPWPTKTKKPSMSPSPSTRVY